MFDFEKHFEKMVRDTAVNDVVILGHINPDGDAAGSVMGLSHYLQKSYPKVKVHPYLADNLDKGPKRYVMGDGSFSPFKKPILTNPYICIVCDTSKKDRIAGQELYDAATATLVIDHHEVNPGYGTLSHIKYYSSCAEVLLETLNSEKLKKQDVHESHTTADYLYMGLIHDTKNYNDIYGGSTFLSAGMLIQCGANASEILKTFNVSTLDDYQKEGMMASELEIIGNGKAVSLFVDRRKAEANSIEWLHMKKIANETRKLEGVDISIVFYEQKPGQFRISSRADGVMHNAISYIEEFGGAGHPHAAGLIIDVNGNEMLEIKEKILQNIIDDIER